MKKIILGPFLGVVVLSVVVLMTSFEVKASEFLDFTTTCSNINLEKASILADCKAGNGGVYKSAIRLRGVNNVRGVLVYDGGSSAFSKFHKTCMNAAIDSRGVLGAKCYNSAKKEYIWTTLDLSDKIANYNGTLVFPMTR